MTAWLIRIRRDWLRVPLWSLWFPLVLLPDFTIRALACKEGRARIVQAECWHNVFTMYLIGLDGSFAEEK